PVAWALLSRRPGARAARARGRPRGVSIPDRREDERPRFLVRGTQDRAPLPGPGARRSGDRAPPRRPRRLVSAGDRRIAGAARRARDRRDRPEPGGDRRWGGGERAAARAPGL